MLEKVKNTFRSNSSWKALLLSILVTGIGYGLYKGVLDNYLAEIVTMSEMDRGITEFFRELPGLLLVFFLAVMYTFSAEMIYKIGAVVMLCGMVMLSAVPATKVMVIISIFILSLGEHFQLGMKNTLSLQYANPGQGGKALGYQNSVNNIGTLLGYAVIIAAFMLLGDKKPFRWFFAASAVLIGIGMIISLKMNDRSVPDKSNSRF